MPPVVLTGSVVDLSKIKMKWKETYVSEGLNRKVIPAMPNGIYSGLKLIQNISSPRQVEVSSVPDGTHAAVHLSATGFSTTYHDVAGVSTILNLSSASLDNQEAVITLSITYIIGADTTANWIAYPIADWNALTDAQRAERIVLGTVNVPAAATNITTAMILPRRRSDAWMNIAPGAQSWDPVVKNTSFNASYVSGSYEKWQIPDWDPLTTGGTGGWLFGAGRTGGSFQGLKLDPLTGPYTGQIYQHIGLPVSQTQRIRYRFFKKVTTLAATGTLEFVIQVNTGYAVAPDTEFTVSIPANAVDGSFVEFSDSILLSQIAVPPIEAQCTLKSIGFRATTLAATAVVLFDDVQVWVERAGDQLDSAYGRDTRIYDQVQASPLIVRDRTVGFNSGFPPAAVLDYQATDNEGALWLHHPSFYKQDGTQDPAWQNPAVCLFGRMFIGEGNLSSDTAIGNARILTSVSSTAGRRTLIWQSLGQTKITRKYVDAVTGDLVQTVNARWTNGTNTWTADDTAADASKSTQTGAGWKFDRKDVTTSPWGDAAWNPSAEITGQVNTATPVGSQLLLPRPGLGTDNGVFIGPDGVVAKPFRRSRYDSISFDTASLTSFWAATDNLNSGTVGLGTNDGDAHLLFQTAAIASSRGTARMRGGSGLTTGRSAFPVSTRPGFSIKFRMAGALTNRYDYFGHTDGGNLTDGANSPMCTVIRSTSLGTSFRIHYEDTTNTEFTFDTGFSPTINVWYYMSLIVLGQAPGSFLFRIGTTPDWKSTDTISHVTTTAGNGSLQPDNSGFNWRWGMGCKTTDAVIKQIDLSWVEVFATKEYV